MFKINPLTLIDSYKIDHKNQYITGTEKIYSNMTPRHNGYALKISDKMSEKVVHYNLQALLLEYVEDMDKYFFWKSKKKAVKAYKRHIDKICGKDVIDIKHIKELHDLGYLPLKIKSLPEGSLVNMKIPVLTITNTLPEFFWLVNYVESMLSNKLWKASTVASIAYSYKKLLLDYAKQTGCNPSVVDFQLHDFSYRGLSGTEDACFVGSAHATSFLGSDNVVFPSYVEKFYSLSKKEKEKTYSLSIPATEHSVMCLGIAYNEAITKDKTNDREQQLKAETELFRELVSEKYPSGMVSIVSDTFNFWDVLTKILPQLKENILKRKEVNSTSKVVIRPDSGDPIKIVAGYRVYDCDELTSGMSKYAIVGWLRNGHHSKFDAIKMNGVYWDINALDNELTENEVKGAIQLLWETFGGNTQVGSDGKEYKVLDSSIGLIYGDSITLERADLILARLKDKGFASSNVVFGVGSFSYQGSLTRDTYGYAMKATYGEVKGIKLNLAKDPITDDGVKKSAKGLLRVEKVNDDSDEGYSYVLFEEQTEVEEGKGELKVVFENGLFPNLISFDTIKANINKALRIK